MSSVELVSVSEQLSELRGVLSRDTVMKLPKKGFWQSASVAGAPMTLSLGKVDYADSAGLAWLVNVVKACKSNNISLTISEFPESLRKLAKISDVEQLLPLQ